MFHLVDPHTGEILRKNTIPLELKLSLDAQNKTLLKVYRKQDGR